MKSYNNLWLELCSYENLELAFKKARKGKTKMKDVIEFEKNWEQNLLDLKEELLLQTYKPFPLQPFLIYDPKTRKISKSYFRDRVVHHALINIIGQIFDNSFIYDSYANRKGKGTLKALQRFDYFKRKVSKNNTRECFVLKADIKHYFEEVNHSILLDIISRRVKDKNVIWLIKQILKNSANFKVERAISKGMPLGNLTSQIFANLYLNKVDNFIKRRLKVKFYIRYVDDFVILSESREQLEEWEYKIRMFLKQNLNLELHEDKTRIISLKQGVDFIGFRNFPHHKLLRKRNIRKVLNKVNQYNNREISFADIFNMYAGWKGFSSWANTFKFREEIKNKITQILLFQI